MNVAKRGPTSPEPIRETSFRSLGLVEWFRIGEHQRVEQAMEDIQSLGVGRLRTGVSWADWHRTGGREWYDWLFSKLNDKVEILPCLLWTPPSLGIERRTNSPPKDPKAYADFADVILTRYGRSFAWVELWNEPNNISEWDWRLDPSWETFARMVGGAAYWVKHRGWKTVLGGMSPIDTNWLDAMFARGVMKHIDAVGIHGFPETFDPHWEGWPGQISLVKAVLEKHSHRGQIWITETGFSTWRRQYRRQMQELLSAVAAPAQRVYWYSLQDLDPSVETIDGFHCNEVEYHFGLKEADGKPKPLFRLMCEGQEAFEKRSRLYQPVSTAPAGARYAMITGGAGFIGTNLAHRLMQDKQRVLLYDNLSRPGVERNIDWLKKIHGDLLEVVIGDVRDQWELSSRIRHASAVFHLAAQVAVTTSMHSPLEDFDVNALGTMRVLEALRQCDSPPPLLFTSTNKVYGTLDDVNLVEVGLRYEPREAAVREKGVAENRPLSFHSPYGCSKGCADQYVLDFCRTFGIPTVVFRMSCIYGPHQLGTEDQGWLAHFLIRAVEGGPLTIYGDGKQVRDVLYVDELVNAMLLAVQNVGVIGGEAYNIGGGPTSTVSLLELLEMIEELHGHAPQVTYRPWRMGDQRYYVSDISRFCDATGWRPTVTVSQGLRRLYEWMGARRLQPAKLLDADRSARQPQSRAASQLGA